jgi:hypothetical protein
MGFLMLLVLCLAVAGCATSQHPSAVAGRSGSAGRGPLNGVRRPPKADDAGANAGAKGPLRDLGEDLREAVNRAVERAEVIDEAEAVCTGYGVAVPPGSAGGRTQDVLREVAGILREHELWLNRRASVTWERINADP